MRSTAICIAFLLCACGSDEGALEFAAKTAWPQRSFLPPAEGPRLVVTNSGDDTLTFVDAASFERIGSVPVGNYPVELEASHHVAATPDGRFLFVGIANTVDPGAVAGGPHGSHGTGTADGYLLKVDAITGRQIARARVERSPGDVRLQPGSNRIWQSHYDLVTIAEVLGRGGSYEETISALIVTDGMTMERVARIPVCPAGHGIGFAPDGSRAYVSCGWSDEVAMVDTATFEVELVKVAPDAGELALVRYEPYALTVAPDGKIWVSNTSPLNRGLRVIDPARGEELPELALSLEGTPLFGDFTADGSRFFLAMQQPDRLLEIDPTTGGIARSVDLAPLGCENTHVSILSPDESELWVVCEGDRLTTPGTLERFDVETLGHTGSLELGLFPDDVAFIPEVRR